MSDEQSFIMMSMPGALMLRADGSWSHEGERVTHEGLVAYLFRHLMHDPATGNFVVAHGSRAVPILVEDTPYFIRTIDTLSTPWSLLLTGETTEPFAPQTIRIGAREQFYVAVKQGQFEAKLLRPAWQALLPFVEESPNGFFLQHETTRIPIRPR